MLAAHGVRKQYGSAEILLGADWAIPQGSRWGLVGANGAGKTTLLRILAREEEPDAGSVDLEGGASVAYLAQEPVAIAPGAPDGSLLEAILSPFAAIAAMEAEILRLQHLLSESPADSAAIAARLGEEQHRFEAAGGYRLESEARIILGGLGFPAEDASRPYREFSGGWRMRAVLGSLLLRRPDYLLLDEPTNHLDLDGIGWLESYLSRLPSAVVVVSHDRLFLNRVSQSIAEVEEGRVQAYRGDYDAYRAEKALRRERAEAAAAREEKRTAEVERFIERFRYKATKARQVQDRIKMLERSERTDVPGAEASWGFRLPSAPKAPRLVLDLRGIRKSYGPRVVLDGLDLSMERGDRVALAGPNGCGKSTLLKIAAGMMVPDAGDIDLGEGVEARLLAQHVVETLTPGRTVLEELQEMAPRRGQGDLRSLLGIFQFSGDDVFKKVEVLSGGEKNRLALARLALDPGNFLLLDEPTNHLDFTAREALEQALAAWDGAVLFVSHDRYFINRVARRVAGFAAGRLVIVEGGYDEWVSAAPRGEPEPGSAGVTSSRTIQREMKREERRAAAEARNIRNQRLRGLRKKVAEIEASIGSRESRLSEIGAALSDPETYRREGLAESLGKEKKGLEEELAALIPQWERCSSELQIAESTE